MSYLNQIREKIRCLIKTNQLLETIPLLEEAIKFIDTSIKDQYENEISVISGDLCRVKMYERMEVYKRVEINQSYNKLSHQILLLTDEICK